MKALYFQWDRFIGHYGIRYTTDTRYDLDLPDVTLATKQALGTEILSSVFSHCTREGALFALATVAITQQLLRPMLHLLHVSRVGSRAPTCRAGPWRAACPPCAEAMHGGIASRIRSEVFCSGAGAESWEATTDRGSRSCWRLYCVVFMGWRALERLSQITTSLWK